MCTGSSARRAIGHRRARRVGVEVQRDRVDVGEHRAARARRAPRWRDATNENGDVTTSSPSPTRRPRAAPGAARSSRTRPRMACGAPTRAANASSNAGTRGPSDSWPGAQHLEHELLLARADDGLGERDHTRSRAGCSAYSSESTSASHDAAMMFSLTPIEPHDVVAVGRVEQHARDRVGALRLVEDADLEVDELDVLQVRVDLADRVAQRAVERVDRAVALGGAHVALAVDPDLDRRLGLDLAVGALLDDAAPRLQAEQRLVLAGLLAHQQLERAVGGLEVVAAVLELLDALGQPRARAASSSADAGRRGLLGHGAAARSAR